MFYIYYSTPRFPNRKVSIQILIDSSLYPMKMMQWSDRIWRYEHSMHRANDVISVIRICHVVSRHPEDFWRHHHRHTGGNEVGRHDVEGFGIRQLHTQVHSSDEVKKLVMFEPAMFDQLILFSWKTCKERTNRLQNRIGIAFDSERH